MSGIVVDHRARRREATRQEILQAAWDLVHERGLTGLSMRDLGSRVGMRAQSLYSYFPSKNAIYDAMFADANRTILAQVQRRSAELAPADGSRSSSAHRLRTVLREFFDYCVEDAVRYQLLYQRTIPDFEPSPEAFLPAQQLLGELTRELSTLGVDGHGVDLMTAVVTGLTAQQLSNDPGGDRWARWLDVAIDMVLDTLSPDAVGGEQD